MSYDLFLEATGLVDTSLHGHPKNRVLVESGVAAAQASLAAPRRR